MKKLLAILVIVLVIALGATLAVYLVSHKRAAQQPAPGPSFPAGGTVTSQSGATQTLVQTTGGGAISVNDPLADPATVEDPVNKGYYYLGYHTSASEQADVPYVIEYIASSQYFNVSLLKEPLGQTRKDAEAYLMSHLGITQQQMCALNYTVSVPSYVSDVYAGQSLGFSFCPGATALP